MLAKRDGLDLALAFDAIRASSGNSFVHETESQVILSGSYDIGFTMLARGASGTRPEIAERLVDALNEGATPRVRTLGSVGQADLGPNADLAYGLLGGFELSAGEALVLVDNNAFSTAAASLAVADFATLLDALEVAGALDFEGFAANLSVLDSAIPDARPYPNLAVAVSRLRTLLDGSWLWSELPRNLQDPLTFRTLPQVLAATRDGLDYAKGVMLRSCRAARAHPLGVVCSARGRQWLRRVGRPS